MKEIEMIGKKLKRVFDDAGGELGIENILTRFYEKLKDDILIGFFFDGKDLNHIIQQQKFFLLRAMGVSREYKGKPPSKAHEKLAPILSGHFDRRLVVLRETLQEFKLSEDNIKTWVDFENTFRASIVHKSDKG